MKPRAKKKKFSDFYDLKILGISQSSMRNFMVCRRKWMLSIAGLERKGVQLNTHFGSIVHEMLDKVYQNIHNLQLDEYETFITKELDKYLKANRDEIYIPTEQFDIEREMAIASTLGYFKHFSSDKANFSELQPEYEFAIPYNGVTLRGKVDGVTRLKGKALWQVEHKTKSRVDEDSLLQSLRFDFQNLMYSFVLDKENTEPIKGVLYNIIRKPQLRRGKEETLKAFLQRIKIDIDKRADWYYTRYEIVYSAKDKRNFKTQLDGILQELKLFISGELPDIQNPAQCTFPFKCPFLNFCATGSLSGLHLRESIHPELDIHFEPDSRILKRYGITKEAIQKINV